MDSVHIPFMMPLPPVGHPSRNSYRHGDLRRALLDAGVELARAGGPEAVVLREATRRAGVVPNAAYRHFANRQDLLHAVRGEALATLAQAMQQTTAASRLPDSSPLAAARAGLRAVGAAYLRFALAEPGLFRTACWMPDPASATEGPADSEPPPGPLHLLGRALDHMVEAGALPRERRPGAEHLAWSAVHGLAMLVLEGPLRDLPAGQIEDTTARLLSMVERGL